MKSSAVCADWSEMGLSAKHMLLGAILGLCACGNPPPHLILLISDTESLSQEADGVAIGESLTTMKHFELGYTGLPITLTLRSKDNGERNLWVESRKGDEVLARGRIKVRFRRKKTITYTASLWHHCLDDSTNDGAMCSLSDPDLGRGECVAGTCLAFECGDGAVGLNEVCDDGNQLGGDYCSADCLTVIGECGDGTRQDNEVCEDANTQDGDYCSADCLTVTGLCGDNLMQDNEVCDTQDGDYCSSDCQSVIGYCGDEIVQTGEVCDDGNNVGEDYCSQDCSTLLGFCGDSVVQSIEACDDGDPTSGDDDGCPADCLTVEDGWSCAIVGLPCSENCGDGLKVGEEVCDDANTSTHDGCAEDCRSIQSGWACLVAGEACTTVCGDGIEVMNEEECDDGNAVTETCTYDSMAACTVCDANCQEVPGALSYCGDGDVDAGDGEECDHSGEVTSECDYGETACYVCDAGCLNVVGQVSYCADALIDAGNGEACDDGNEADGDGCAADCSTIESGWLCETVGQPCEEDCGDGQIVGDEACDDGNNISADGCHANCVLEPGWLCETAGEACVEVCGDGIVSSGEACDDGTGSTAGPVPEDTTTCDADCTLAACPDNYPNTVAGEICDDGNGVDGDGCDSNCTTTGCGNTIVTDGEDCDDGNNLNDDYCSNTCEDNGFCGDGVPQLDVEECDDAQVGNNNLCLSTCVLATCGDGHLCSGGDCTSGPGSGAEECDDGNAYDMDDCSTSCTDTVLAVHELALGLEFSCALFSNGRIGCWGNPVYGRLGRGDSDQIGHENALLYQDFVEHYVALGDNGRAKQIVSGEKFSCALLNNGSVKCWGENSSGQLGLGHSVDRGSVAADMGNNLPVVDFGTATAVKSLCAGGSHACALFDDDTLKCWGENAHGQLGLDDKNNRGDDSDEMGTALPAVDLGAGFVPTKIDCGEFVSCAFSESQGAIKCWGYNGVGQLGQGNTHALGDGEDEMGNSVDEMGNNLLVIDLGFNVDADGVFAGQQNVCASIDDGTLKCWGSNTFSQLYPGYGVGGSSSMVGDQNDDMGDNLETFSLGGDFLQVALSRHDICVLMDSVPREIKCWGLLNSWPNDNDVGSNGHDAVFIPNTEVVVEKLFIGDNHAIGRVHGCALLQDGTVKCWGYNGYGQLGLGDTTNRSVVNGDVLPDLQLLAP